MDHSLNAWVGPLAGSPADAESAAKSKGLFVGFLCDYIQQLLLQGGPKESQYTEIERHLKIAYDAFRAGEVSPENVAMLRAAMGDALSMKTMGGFVYQKPHGYAGDFEIIDRIYNFWMSPDPSLTAWDVWFHELAAAKAVRNRKDYFQGLLDSLFARKESPRVLELASGPGRSMFEWLERHPREEAHSHFDCVEIDADAIRHATTLNKHHMEHIHFIHKNVFRFRPEGEYDLIWSAGLFDYFDDRIFAGIAGRLLPHLAPGGELVIGNFSPVNPARPVMELLGDWNLIHRSKTELTALMRKCGAKDENIRVGQEPEGVNLFVHVARGT